MRDTPPSQQAPARIAGVAAVGEQPLGALARRTGVPSRSRRADRVERLPQQRRLVALPRRSPGPRADGPFRPRRDEPWSKIRAGLAPPPRPAGSANPFFVASSRPRAPACRVLVGAHHGRVQAHVLLHLSDRVGLGLGEGQQAVPGAVPAPADESVVAGLPGAVALGQIPPGRPCPELPEDAVHYLAVVAPSPAGPAPIGQ